MKDSLAELKGQSVYIDANIFIYLLDGGEPFVSMVKPFFESVLNNEIIAYTGDAVIAEVMVRPYKLGDLVNIERFKAFFAQERFLSVVSHDAGAFDLAAQLSGTKEMKLVDALHMATAIRAGCGYLITHDRGMKAVGDLKIVRL